MNKKELAKRIINMEYGDCFDIKTEQEFANYTMITKTRWFDNHVIIIGGADNHTTKIFNINKLEDDNEILANNVCDGLCEMFNLDENVGFEITATNHLTLEVDHGGLFDRKVDNFIYHK